MQKFPVSGEQTKNRINCAKHQEEVKKYCSECRQKNESNSMKYFGVIIDSKLRIDVEVKKILKRMACGTKVLNTLSKSLPEKSKILLLNACSSNKSSTFFRFNFDRVAKIITHNFRKAIELRNKNYF